MLVEQLLATAKERLVTVTENEGLATSALLLGERQTQLVIVCGAGGAMVGVISKTDIVRQIGLTQNSCDVKAAAVMTKEVTSCRPKDFLHDVWLKMKAGNLLHIPILDENFRPLGVVSARDALFTLLEGEEYEESLLRDYVTGIGYR